MPSFTAVASLLAVAAVVQAQSFALGGPGRFPCTQTDAAGVRSADATQCTTAAMTANQACPPDAADLGAVDGGFKNNGVVPTNGAQCVLDTGSGDYFCGFAGAVCTSSADCDNGACGNIVAATGLGTCVGTFTTACTLDSQCLGNYYCLTAAGDSTGSCGNINAFCSDGCAAGNFLCASGVCDGNTAQCVAAATVGVSQRARSRRSDITARGGKCPAGHTACSISGSLTGFECIDTSSNLEQCGACATQGGVDCTALPGVDAVGCVAGSCEIWACAEGFAWDASSAACAVALVA